MELIKNKTQADQDDHNLSQQYWVGREQFPNPITQANSFTYETVNSLMCKMPVTSDKK